MYAIAEQVKNWADAERPVHVATVVATQGFSSREPAASAAWTDGAPAVGRLVEGIAPETLPRDGLVDVSISQEEAVAAGLACGGRASILVRPAGAYPAELWDRLLAREPVCLVVPVNDPQATATLYTPETIRDAHDFGDEVPRLFGRGTTDAALIGDSAVLAFWPVPTMVVMGDGLIADALRDTGRLLGWQVQVLPEVQHAVSAVSELSASDAVVVLSHDRAADGPTLAAALGSAVGYVGALGSRRTQVARTEWLTEHGIASEVQARIHGPAGLDIDAHSPAEIAISIVAEIIANRGAGTGGALRSRPGPVHMAGVQAPPPRY
ncbi:MAG TPA: XdhC family protein [Jatrophihabitans sp.]|nr:XdhC family protein [Jatrophihabitans sp.]